MSGTVRVPRSVLSEVVQCLRGPAKGPWAESLAGKLDRWISASQKVSEKTRDAMAAQRARMKATRQAHNEETAEIRRLVMERSGGKCECGCGLVFDRDAEWSHTSPEMDHFFSRGRAQQTVRNCWMLTSYHHDDKTRNRPGSAYWLGLFIAHAKKHGYTGEAEMAQRRLDAITLTRGGGNT